MEQAETPSTSRGYYCHSCNNTISIPITNFLCPDCHQGFIEKLPDTASASSPFSERGAENRDDMEADPVVVLNRVFDDISSNLEVIMGGGESNARNTDNRPSSSSRRDTSSNPNRQNERRRGRNQHTATFEQMLTEFLSNIPRNQQNFDGNAPVLLVGNPGDYAWGREGLDTIVTQLLNQMDSSGPPPLAKDKINELPFVSITAQQVSENMQCSVCWDSFKMTEKVRQLPCDHIYHDLCIVPWLELHGTCPICRKLLSDDNEARLGFPHTGGLEALLSDVHRLSILQQTYTPSSTSGWGGATSSSGSSRRNNVRCYRCNKIGHYARECTTRQSSGGADRCYKCDQSGHLARNCHAADTVPQRRRNRSQSRRRGRGRAAIIDGLLGMSTSNGGGSWSDSTFSPSQERRGRGRAVLFERVPTEVSSNRGGSWSDSTFSPSQAAPLHEFLQVDFGYDDDDDDYLSNSVSGSDVFDNLSLGMECGVCGLDYSEHPPEMCTLDTLFRTWDNDMVSPSGGSSSNSAANFAGFRQTNGSGGGSGSNTTNGRKRKLICHKCHKPGHMARDCWKKTCQRCSRNYNSCECSTGPTSNDRAASTSQSSWSTPNNRYGDLIIPLNDTSESPRRPRWNGRTSWPRPVSDPRIPLNDASESPRRATSTTNHASTDWSPWSTSARSIVNRFPGAVIAPLNDTLPRPFNAAGDRCDRCYKNHRTSDCRYLRESTPEWCKSSRSNNFTPRASSANPRTHDGSGPSTSRYHHQSGGLNNHENYRCFQCHQLGHIARNCPAPVSGTNEGRVRLCRTCGAEGHFSRDCTSYHL